VTGREKPYIVAEAEDGLVIVDQHAAHERLVLERMRRRLTAARASQALLICRVVELDENGLATGLRRAWRIVGICFNWSALPGCTCLVRATPRWLGSGDVKGLHH